jgi:glyoxylase-like metal-dependent hydrolase (beta-lactamase superfamily II)
VSVGSLTWCGPEVLSAGETTVVLVIDTGLPVGDVAAPRARLAALRKPMPGVFALHQHPVHFNGVLGLVRDKKVPVYASDGRPGGATPGAAGPTGASCPGPRGDRAFQDRGKLGDRSEQ